MGRKKGKKRIPRLRHCSMTVKRYLRFTNDKLKEMCKQRRLAVSGPKQKKAQRLLAWDAQHPFRFLDLPGEIQDMIYRIHAATDFEEYTRSKFECLLVDPQDHPSDMYRLRFGLHPNSRPTLRAPGLFLANKKTRENGLSLFYLERQFLIETIVNRKRATFATLEWFQAIGDDCCKLIRHLEINIDSEREKERLESCQMAPPLAAERLERVHQNLSDKAEVVYYCPHPMWMWDIGALFQARHPAGRGPIWRTTEKMEFSQPSREDDEFVLSPASPERSGVAWSEFTTLTFQPNMSWFGRDASTAN